MSSSTSSSEALAWRRCAQTLCATAAAGIVGTWLFIVLVDPFDTLHLSPALDRAPVTVSQRHAYPALARRSAFDSAQIGSSTMRLLDPQQLDERLGGSFVNLAMDGAVPAAQREILRVFASHHPEARAVVVGIDQLWILPASGEPRDFALPLPAWMYDDDPWNDYAAHFDTYALRHAARQLSHLMGAFPALYRDDGYARFMPDPADYDEKKVHQKLYGGDSRPEALAKSRAPRAGPPVAFDTETLASMLAGLSALTEKVVVLLPAHVVAQPPMGPAKAGLVRALRPFENLRVLDCLIPSDLTRVDGNFWDRSHFTDAVSALVVDQLERSRKTGYASPSCRMLFRS